MNPQSTEQAKQLFVSVKEGVEDFGNTEIVICPPFLYLSTLSAQSSIIKLGSQDCFWENSGAFTGEISPLMLKTIGCKYVIIGHSERRQHLTETDKIINRKLRAVLKIGLCPILCVGETLQEKQQGKTEAVLKKQLTAALNNIQSPTSNSPLLIAYEPVWAIGTGENCEPKIAHKLYLFLKEYLEKTFDIETRKNISILYGGSVNHQNIKDYIAAGFQGVLIGSVALKPHEFIETIKVLNED